MMINKDEISIPDGQPYFYFNHQGKDYCIYQWLQDSNESWAMCFAELTQGSNGYNPKNLIAKHSYQSRIDEAGGIRPFMDEFINEVNQWLLENNGSSPFPEDENLVKQFNWIVESAIFYESETLKIINF